MKPPGRVRPRASARVLVFVDYMNVYHDLRRAFFGDKAPSTDGQIDPVALARLLAARGSSENDWKLAGVRVYTGQPIHERQPKAAAAHDRQVAVWRKAGAMVFARPLKYSPDDSGPGHQKGVDVALAVDVIALAYEARYEVAVIASTDTDFVPAIEAVQRLRGSERLPRVCVVSYEGLKQRLRLRGASTTQPWAFQLTWADYQAVKDSTAYG